MTLTEFLLARIAEDEASATNWVRFEVRDGILCYYAIPERVHAECEAKRRIVEDYLTLDADYRVTHAAETGARRFQALVSVAQLAMAHSDHPEYDEGWRP